MGCKPFDEDTLRQPNVLSGTLCLCDSGDDCNKVTCTVEGILDSGTMTHRIELGSWLCVVAFANFLSILAKFQYCLTILWVSYPSKIVPIQYCVMKLDIFFFDSNNICFVFMYKVNYGELRANFNSTFYSSSWGTICQSSYDISTYYSDTPCCDVPPNIRIHRLISEESTLPALRFSLLVDRSILHIKIIMKTIICCFQSIHSSVLKRQSTQKSGCSMLIHNFGPKT